MTDTQEAMRKTGAEIIAEYRNQSFATCQLSLEEMIDREIERCTAQSAEKIADTEGRLLLAQSDLRNAKAAYEEQIASLSEKIARLAQAQQEWALMNRRTEEKLAAAELSNKQLREAVDKLDRATEEYEGDDGIYLGIWLDDWHEFTDALTQPISTEALDAYVASKVKWVGRCVHGKAMWQADAPESQDLYVMPLPPAPDKE